MAACPCLTVGGGGILPPGGTDRLSVGAPEDSNNPGAEPCCGCPEHLLILSPDTKVNAVRKISSLLTLRRGSGGAVAEGERLEGPVALVARGTGLSARFNDTRAAFSQEDHPEETAWEWARYTEAAIGLEPDAGIPRNGESCLIRGGVGCASRVAVATRSALTEGSVSLSSGDGGLFFSGSQGAQASSALTLKDDSPPASVSGSRDFWLGATNGGLYTLTYELLPPEGGAVITSNLTVEAVMVRVATNAYWAAYGSTEPLEVGLDPVSHDPNGYSLSVDGEEVDRGAPQWYVDASCLTAGVHTLTVRSETFPDLEDSATINVIQLPKLLMDTNRDGSVDESDETDKNVSVTFEGPKGAVILANADDDASGQTAAPDCSDNVINGSADLPDIYPLKIKGLGIPSSVIPDGFTVTLSVANPPEDSAGTPAANDRVRIFSSRTSTASGIIGPDPLTGSVTFRKNPGDGELDIALLAGTDGLELGLEGIAFGRQVVVSTTGHLGGVSTGSDSARLLVSPFLALSNVAPASKVYIGADASEYGWPNFYASVSAALAGVVPLESYCPMSYIQDKAEIGYMRSAPGQTERKQNVVMGLVGDWFKELLDADTGYFQNQIGIAGGNLEVSPPVEGFDYGRLIVGAGLPASTKEFFKAQKVQTDSGNLIELPVSWLRVGHVDEVMSIIPVGSGFKVLVADLQLAIDLLRNNPTNETWGGFTTSAQILAEYDANSNRVAEICNHLADVRSSLAQGLGVNESTFIKVPVAFTIASDDHVGTYLPNMVNMIVVKNESGSRRLVVPEPFFDPFWNYLAARLGEQNYQSNEIFSVDTTGPNSGGGEAHCASNVRHEAP